LGGEPSRLTWVNVTSPRTKGGSFRLPVGVSQRAHFVLRDPMEDDRPVFTKPRPRRPSRPVGTLTLAAGALLALVPVVGVASAGASSRPAMASGTHYPLVIRQGHSEVRIPARPVAIVSLSPTATEMLYAIGAGSQVKAVDKDSDYPAHAPHTALDGNSPNAEAIAAYKPDLVVAAEGTNGLGSELAKLGIPLIVNPAASNLSQEYSQFLELGKVTGHQADAKAEVAQMKGQVARIVASVPKRPHSLTYYYELDQTYYSETSSTFIGQLLGLLGLHSIADAAKGAAASGGYPQLSGEFVLKANPDYVLLADVLCCGQSPATVAARPGWSNLAAVKHGRVLSISDDIASRWGPRIVVLLADVADELKTHPVSGH
jgi:cobalamin transport system substrate-binding protein